MLSVNLDRLERAMRDFHVLTGIRMVLIDETFQELAGYPKQRCALCRLLRENPAWESRCRQSDLAAFAQCREAPGVHIYPCHAGLTEAAMSIRDEGVIIGYLMFGQAWSGQDLQALKRTLTDQFPGLDAQRMHAAVENLPRIDEGRLNAAATILEAMTLYFLSNRFVMAGRQDFRAALDDYIHEHLSEEIHIQDICRAFGLGRTRLFELCREHLGASPNAYIQHWRMQRARELLRTTDMRISEIAAAVGYGDYNYFCRVFRGETGATAREYRAAKRTRRGE